jgi:hypothetical protein
MVHMTLFRLQVKETFQSPSGRTNKLVRDIGAVKASPNIVDRPSIDEVNLCC